MTTATPPVTRNFDPLSARFRENPYTVFAELRQEGPVLYVPDLDVFIVTRYEQVTQALLDRDNFLSEGASGNFFPVCEEAQAILTQGFPRKPTFTNADPPRHTDMRASAAQCLTPRRWSASQPMVREHATQLINALVAKPVADLQMDFAYPLPAFAGFALLGFPLEDTVRLKDWCNFRILLTYGRLDPSDQVKAAHELTDFWRYCAAHVERRQREPPDDLTTDLLRQGEKTGKLVPEDVVNMVYSISLAAHETSQNAMLNGMRALLQQRDQWDLLCADPTLIPGAVEELLRFESPQFALRRRAARDTELAGVAIPAGSRLLVLTGSANRDEAQFPGGHRIDVRRANARTNVTFGKQWHFCLGAPLARFEYTLLLELLTQRAPRMALVPNQPFEYHPLMQFRALKHLQVMPNGQ